MWYLGAFFISEEEIREAREAGEPLIDYWAERESRGYRLMKARGAGGAGLMPPEAT